LPAKIAAPLAALPIEKNIVYKAAELFFKMLPPAPRAAGGGPRPLAIKLIKRIPSGAGLGGGSSDAAATLIALNQMAGGPRAADPLRRAAASLGSDVPFFLSGGGAAYVSGRGENIQIIPAPKIYAVLLNPLFESGTACAFNLLDEYRKTRPAANVVNEHITRNTNKELITPLSLAPEVWQYSNDFLPALLASGSNEEKKTYTGMLSDLKKAGADFAGLSGSGSTCFGIFADKSKAEAASAALKNTWSFVRCCSGCQPYSIQ
jgi:4-diphosphocytidyl-2-C-methyl-D-erythritol kinase